MTSKKPTQRILKYETRTGETSSGPARVYIHDNNDYFAVYGNEWYFSTTSGFIRIPITHVPHELILIERPPSAADELEEKELNYAPSRERYYLSAFKPTKDSAVSIGKKSGYEDLELATKHAIVMSQFFTNGVCLEFRNADTGETNHAWLFENGIHVGG